MPGSWGVESIDGQLVAVTVTSKVCVLCEREECTRYEDGKMVSRTYSDGTPVRHE